MHPLELPVEMPEGWTAELSKAYGTIITGTNAAGQAAGYVTVAEDLRSFALGIRRPRASGDGNKYSGRGWKAKLYRDAVASLMSCIQGQDTGRPLT